MRAAFWCEFRIDGDNQHQAGASHNATQTDKAKALPGTTGEQFSSMALG